MSGAAELLADVLARDAAPCVAAIGTFDGVHAGHRRLVAAARALAQERGLETVAVTFSPRPERVFRPHEALPDVCSLPERERRLKAAGADRVVVIPFGGEVAALDYAVFAALLVERMAMRALCVGTDFALGRARAGTPARLRALGIEVHLHDLVPNAAGTAKASSTSVRRAIAAGTDAAEALRAG